MASWGIKKVLRASFDDALARVPDALKTEGFGILTEIDVRETLKKKLDVDFRRYRILGACNPTFAYEALQAETGVGVLLPCNVAVYEADGGGTVVVAVDPLQSIGAFADGDEQVLTLARTVREKLLRVLERLPSS